MVSLIIFIKAPIGKHTVKLEASNRTVAELLVTVASDRAYQIGLELNTSEEGKANANCK